MTQSKKKKLDFLKQYLPVSRKTYYKNMVDLLEVIEGLEIADAHHCQLEMSFIQQFQRMNAPKTKTAPKDDKYDPAFN